MTRWERLKKDMAEGWLAEAEETMKIDYEIILI